MKLVHICFELTIPVLRIIFFVVLLLLAFKTYVHDNMSISKDYSNKAIISYQTELKSNLRANNQTLHIKTFYTHDTKQLTANQTQLINLVNYKVSKPVLVSTNFFDLHQLYNFNNMKNSIKLAIFIHLNTGCSVLNLLIITYFLIYKQPQLENSFQKSFLKVHFYLNLLILFSIVIVSSYFFYYITNTQTLDKSNYLNDWISKILKENTLNSNARLFVDLNNSNSFTNLTDHISQLYLKFNVIVMVFSSCLLASYGYLLYVASSNEENSSNNEQDNDNDDDDELILKEAKSFVQVHEFKTNKLVKHVNIELQWILNSILLMIALSIWDISDVYHHFNSQKYFSGPKFDIRDFSLLKTVNEKTLFLSANDKKSNLILNSLQHGVKAINYTNDLYLDDETNYYKSFVLKRNTQILKYTRDNTNTLTQHYEAITKVKIYFYFKNNSRLFTNILVSVFTFIVIAKLKSIESSFDHYADSIDLLLINI